MSKKLKYLTGCLLTITCFLGCSETRFDDPNGVWICEYLPNTNETECWLWTWTEEYKQTHEYSDYIFFPSHIGDVKVTRLGKTVLNSDNYDGRGKFFLPYTIKSVIFESGCCMISGTDYEGFTGGEKYVPNKYYQAYTDRYPKWEFYKANVVYDINYENNDYQYHSVDYCSYSLTTEQVQFVKTQSKIWKMSPNSDWCEYPTLGKDYLRYNYGKDKWNILDGWKKDENGNEIYTSKIEIIPPAPERDGYTFGGWYKETECINEWDFETDTLPQMQLDENEEIIFQETALYAKWNKN